MQPVLAFPVVAHRGLLEVLALHLDAGAVDEHRHVALLPVAGLGDHRHDPLADRPHAILQPFEGAVAEVRQELPEAAAVGHRAGEAGAHASGLVGGQGVDRVEVPAAGGERVHQGQHRLRVSAAALAALDMHEFLEFPRQADDTRQAGDRRQPGEAGEQAVADAVREFGCFIGKHRRAGADRA